MNRVPLILTLILSLYFGGCTPKLSETSEPLPYLTDDWNRRFYANPGDPEPFDGIVRLPDQSVVTVPVRILGQQIVNGETWFQVETVPDRCEETRELKKKQGWIPEHSKAKALNITRSGLGC